MLIEAQRELETRYGCRIEMQQFFDELNSIDRITAHLAGRTEASANRSAVPVAAPSPKRPEARPIVRAPSPVDPGVHGMLRAQLALVAETIEAQNRMLLDGGRRSGRLSPPGPEARRP